MALDFGLVRIGVAISDPEGQFAFPTTVLDAQDWESALAEALSEYEPVVIYVGYPVTLSGDPGTSARMAREFAIELAGHFGGEIRLVDERLTTKAAMQEMRSSGRSEKESRSSIDAAAATLLLETVLSQEKNLSRFAGNPI
jgi:putative holliday junction resolvase